MNQDVPTGDNMGAFVPAGAPKSSSSKSLVVSIIVIVIIVFAAIWWFGSAPVGTQIETKTLAPQGELVNGFNKGLIIVKDAVITRSSHAMAKAGADSRRDVEVFTAVYTTQSSANSLFEAYLNYMRKEGFQVTSSPVVDSRGQIFASRTLGFATTNITVTVRSLDERTREVNISVNKTL